MQVVTILTIFIMGYLIGNISPSYLTGRIFGKLDIRDYGSGNAGATNVLRVMGWKFGIPVFILDLLKGLATVALGSWLGGESGAAAAAFGVVIGHDAPVFLNFRGGKGIAATTGIFLYLFPVPALAAVLIFVLIIWFTRMVSLGSLVFVTAMMVYTLASGQSVPMACLAIALAVFAVLRHSENIKRILRGEENKLKLGTE